MRKVILLFVLISFLGVIDSFGSSNFRKNKKDKKKIELSDDITLLQFYKDDQVIREEYYYDKKKMCDVYFSNEAKDSVYSFWDNGSVLLKRYYKENEEISEDSLFYQNGVLREHVIYLTDSTRQEITYYESGEQFRFLQFMNGDLNDTCVTYYPDQRIAIMAYFKEGKLFNLINYKGFDDSLINERFISRGMGELHYYPFDFKNKEFSEFETMKMSLKDGCVDGSLYCYDNSGKLEHISTMKSDTLYSTDKPPRVVLEYSSMANQNIVFHLDDMFFDVINDEFKAPHIKPNYPGGDRGLMSFLSENLQYPKDALEAGEKGKVYVQFEINEYGEVGKFKIARGVCESLNQEALRVVSNMPDWVPAFKNNVPVAVIFIVPINFNF